MLTTVIWGLLGLSFLVFFHELGHFAAARAFGVSVEAFSVGMGPVLLHRTVNGTDYRLSLVPIGGYCAMKGEDDYREALELGLGEIGGGPDSFYGVHPAKRAAIGFAGPLFNLLFAFIAFFIVALTGYSYRSAGTTVLMADEVYEGMRSAAHEAGMRSGDTILSLDGKAVSDFSEISSYVATHADEDIAVALLRDGREMLILVHSELDKESGSGRIGIAADPGSMQERTVPGKNVLASAAEGMARTGEFISLTVRSVGILFKGVRLSSAVSGPVRITTLVGSTVKEGFSEGARTGIVSTLELLALISISLFFTNLLPIPALDGALIIFALLQWATGRKMSPKVLYAIQTAGIALIAIVFVLVLFMDIRALAAG